jgi:hypothetical protein
MKYGPLLVAIVLLGANAPAVWLAQEKPVAWNIAGARIPASPIGRNNDLEHGGRCASEIRPTFGPEDRALVRHGWYLIGLYQRYGHTAVVMATSGSDGMCRPNGYQAFVFVDGALAGTLSPRPMDARSDASIFGGIDLFNETELSATFVRYSASDPLCCPHASTTVSYQISGRGDRRVVVPISTATSTR